MHEEAVAPGRVVVLTEHAGPVGMLGELAHDDRYRLGGRVVSIADAMRAGRPRRADAVVADVQSLWRLREIGESDLAQHVALVVVTPIAIELALPTSIAAGAVGFVTKPVRGEVLRNAVLTVLCGGTFLDPPSARWLVEFAFNGNRAHDDGRLTLRQAQVLHLANAGHSNRQIAAALNVSVETVKTHRQDARRRLAAEEHPPTPIARRSIS